ncbi:MAG: hypothetical protein ABEJ80_02820 [Halarchaeum sp.]
MNRAHVLAAVLLLVAVASLANPLYVPLLPEANVLGHDPMDGAATAFAPDLRYLASLALTAVGVFALVGALAALFSGGVAAADEHR